MGRDLENQRRDALASREGMKMKRPIRCFIGIAMLAFSQSTPAAPFLVSDAYPADGPQPDGFVVTLSNSLGTKTVAVPAVKNPDGTTQLKFDLAGLDRAAFAITARAKSAGLTSVETPAYFLYHWIGATAQMWVFSPIQAFQVPK